ncbi:MAG: hypothetical protein U0264_05635 [Candidatus Kapaibacterium sp.]
MIFNYLFILLLTVILPIKSQVITNEYPVKQMPPDSLFTEFEYPRLPSYITIDSVNSGYRYKGHARVVILQVQICISIIVTSDGVAKSIEINPLYNVGNTIPKNDKFWRDLDKNIRSSILKWKFKVWHYPLDYYPKNPYLNKNPAFRPFAGTQIHTIILTYIGDSHQKGFPGLLYWMDGTP